MDIGNISNINAIGPLGAGLNGVDSLQALTESLMGGCSGCCKGGGCCHGCGCCHGSSHGSAGYAMSQARDILG